MLKVPFISKAVGQWRMEVSRELCCDAPCVWKREVGVKLGHERSERGSLSQSDKAEVPTGVMLLLC